MPPIRNRLAAAAIAGAALVLPGAAPAGPLATVEPGPGATMVFADRYASAFYAVDPESFAIVLTITPGPDGRGNPMRMVSRLDDGESATIAFGGHGRNAIEVTLTLTRKGDAVTATVDTSVIKPATGTQS